MTEFWLFFRTSSMQNHLMNTSLQQNYIAEEITKQTRLLSEISKHTEATAQFAKKTYRLLSLLVILFIVIPFFLGIFLGLARCAFSPEGHSSQVAEPLEEYADEY